jgi:hypothetical protein
VVFGFRGVGWDGSGLALLYFSYGHSFVLFVFGHPCAESLKKVSTGVVCI